MKALHLVLNIVALVLLLLFAYVQLNDPDAIIWASLYLLCASIPAMAIFKQFNLYFSVAVLILVAFMAASYFSGFLQYLPHLSSEPLMQGMNDQKPYIEEAREFIGSCIVLLMLLPYCVIALRKKVQT